MQTEHKGRIPPSQNFLSIWPIWRQYICHPFTIGSRYAGCIQAHNCSYVTHQFPPIDCCCEFKATVPAPAPKGGVGRPESSPKSLSGLVRALAADNSCDPKTNSGNTSCKGEDGARRSDLGCRRAPAGSPKSRTSLPVHVAHHRFRVPTRHAKRVRHHDATAAKAPLSRGFRSFQQAGSQPLPQRSVARGLFPPAEKGLTRRCECVGLAPPAMNKPRHMHPV